MILKKYENVKKEVLDKYSELKKILKDEENDLADFDKIAENIKAEVFNLVVLGKHNSGKSTFINAYLSSEILPMDNTSCISAIIKIKNGEEFKLGVKKANDDWEYIMGESNVKQYIKDYAVRNNRFEKIPTALIDSEFLIKYEGDLNRIKVSGLNEAISSENNYDIDCKEYFYLIEQYIEEMRLKWKDIVVEFDIECPLPDEHKGKTIVEVPILSSSGKLGRLAEKNISVANAIIFLESLDDQSQEFNAFQNFLRNNTDKNKEGILFWVRNKIANFDDEKLHDLNSRVIKDCKNNIQEGNILFIDSKMQLFINKCKKLNTIEKIDEYFRSLEGTNFDYRSISNLWCENRTKLNSFYYKAAKKSSFFKLEKQIAECVRKLKYFRLYKLLESIENRLTKIKLKNENDLKLNQKHLKENKAIERKIEVERDRLIKSIEVIKEIYSFVNDMFIDFSENKTPIEEEIKNTKKQIVKSLMDYKNSSDTMISDKKFDILRSYINDGIDNINKKISNIKNKLSDRYNEMDSFCNKESINVKYKKMFGKVIFIELDFERLFLLTKDDANVDTLPKREAELNEPGTNFQQGVKLLSFAIDAFSKDDKFVEYSREEHAGLIINEFMSILENVVVSDLKNFIDIGNYILGICIDSFDIMNHSLESKIDELQYKKNDSEKRKKLFQELEVINRKIYEYLKLVEPLKVEIDNNL